MEKYIAELAGRNCRIEIFLGDCIEGMAAHLPQESVDVVATSPPYNLGVRYGRYDDSVPREDYLAWMDRWAQAVSRVLAPAGSLFLNVGGRPKDPWVPFEVAGVLRRHFVLQNVIHWVKAITIEREAVGVRTGLAEDLSVGHYKPINSRFFLNDVHEFIFHFTRTGWVPIDRLAIGVAYQDKSNIARWKSAGRCLRCRGNVWFIPYETIQDRARERPHPASFPPRLPEMCIRLHGLESTKCVLDPFAGLGNTAIACVQLGVRFVGFEIDPAYYAEAVRRVRAAAGGLFHARERSHSDEERS